MEVSPIRPSGAAAFESPGDAAARSESPQQAPAAQVGAAAGQAIASGNVRSIGDVQRFVSAVKTAAEESAGSLQAGTEGEGGGSGALPYENLAASVVNEVNRNADRVFQVVMQFAGDDPKLLQQAKTLVAKVFDQYKDHQPTPMLAFMTQERVMDMINARLAQVASGKDVNFSA